MATGVAVAGCSGGGDGGDDSSDDGADDSTTDDDNGQTTDSGDGSAAEDGSAEQDGSNSTDGDQSFEAETSELQEAVDTLTGDWEVVDVDGTVRNDVDGLEVAESAPIYSADYSRFSVLLAMRNVGSEQTRFYRYGYHLQSYDENDQLLSEASQQSADGPRADPEGVDVTSVTAIFSGNDEPGIDDIARYEAQVNCEHAGGSNPNPDGAYCR